MQDGELALEDGNLRMAMAEAQRPGLQALRVQCFRLTQPAALSFLKIVPDR